MPKFRDPIHGFIEVTDLELKIIDSVPFQRLRNIKQLATTYLVYHGAEHTRFGHSLGVMHLVSRAFNLSIDNYEKRNGKELFDLITRKWYEQILRLIALIHDLGHAPFSHGTEALFDEGVEHEDFTKRIIYETKIKDYIKEVGEDFIKRNNADERFAITAELLWLIYGEKNPEMNPNYVIPDFKFLRGFMDSDIDCDKMDYLLRDSYYCGVNYGNYDLNRLLSSLTVYHKKSENRLQLSVERGGIHAFEEFIIARYFMFIQVYFHRTRRYLDKLLVNSISVVLPNGYRNMDTEEYLTLDDDTIYNMIKNNQDNKYTKQFVERQVMSCVYETTVHIRSGSDADMLRTIKRELKSIPGCQVVEDSSKKMAHKIPLLEMYDEISGKGVPIIVPFGEIPRSVMDESLLLQSLYQPINIKRLYVDHAHADKAREIVLMHFRDEGDEDND